MYDENQIIKMRWNNFNQEWYESKGYKYNGKREEFDICVKDLPEHSSAKINATCDYCGDDYLTQYASIINGRKIIQKDACHHCATKKANEISRQKRAAKYIGLAKKFCEEKGYVLLTTENEYTDIKMFVDFVCPKHGKQTIRLEVLLRGGGCLPCAIEYRARKLSLGIDEVKVRIESINNNTWLNPEDYINNHTTNLKILCSCGNIFTTSFMCYEDGTNKCSRCSQKESRGEEQIRKFLELNKIDFVQEKRFDDCRDKIPLPFDFYLPLYNLIIEFDGKHHYEPTYGEEHHMSTVKHDKIKNQYCEDNNINLLRIPYWEGNNIEDIISKQLNL